MAKATVTFDSNSDRLMMIRELSDLSPDTSLEESRSSTIIVAQSTTVAKITRNYVGYAVLCYKFSQNTFLQVGVNLNFPHARALEELSFAVARIANGPGDIIMAWNDLFDNLTTSKMKLKDLGREMLILPWGDSRIEIRIKQFDYSEAPSFTIQSEYI
ncbi:unnamed protein product [Allacma fusca]|uniref:Uncharacterized protein n=1 Tax=Allacma fusca TaxID=39272 RepID=A0A8J2P1W2_9HEXA|nr:unnamed protein product [Allacma fusca]